MSDKVKIYFIYANDCEECKKMRDVILRAMRDSKIESLLDELDSETDEAIELGTQYNINDLPACIIGRYTFCGKKYSYCGFIDAIEDTWKEQQRMQYVQP